VHIRHPMYSCLYPRSRIGTFGFSSAEYLPREVMAHIPSSTTTIDAKLLRSGTIGCLSGCYRKLRGLVDWYIMHRCRYLNLVPRPLHASVISFRLPSGTLTQPSTITDPGLLPVVKCRIHIPTIPKTNITSIKLWRDVLKLIIKKVVDWTPMLNQTNPGSATM
jgi:hypothetical protein